MRNFAIVTDSCGDLGENLRTKYNIDYVPMRISYDDVDVPASLDWEYIPLKTFYDLMRKGKRIKTSQVNAEESRQGRGRFVYFLLVRTFGFLQHFAFGSRRNAQKISGRQSYLRRFAQLLPRFRAYLHSRFQAPRGRENLRRSCRIYREKQAQNEPVLHG